MLGSQKSCADVLTCFPRLCAETADRIREVTNASLNDITSGADQETSRNLPFL